MNFNFEGQDHISFFIVNCVWLHVKINSLDPMFVRYSNSIIWVYWSNCQNQLSCTDSLEISCMIFDLKSQSHFC